MCTVTYFKNDSSIIITSTRDEHIDRPDAINPISEILNGVKIWYPKDPKANGTWFAINDKMEVIVLLNGAQSSHVSKKYYEKSRGIILLELITSGDILKTWESINLKEIEPFTLVVCFKNKLFQLQWDYVNKSKINLNVNAHYLWASRTLYTPEIIEKRNIQFNHFISTQPISPANIAGIHTSLFHTKVLKNKDILRENIITKSVTQLYISEDSASLSHQNLISNSNQTITVEL